MSKLPLIIVAAALVFGLSSAARAATYNWAYVGTTATDNASGTLTTGAADMGGFDVTAITGTYNGFAISAAPLSSGTCCSTPLNDNIVYPDKSGSSAGVGSTGMGPGSGGYLDLAGLGLLVPGDPSGPWIQLLFLGEPTKMYADDQGGLGMGSEVVSFGNFTLTATPLPAALPLLATGLGALGLLGWRRKRKAQAKSIPLCVG